MYYLIVLVVAVTLGDTRICFAGGDPPAIDVDDPGWQFANTIERTKFGWLAKGGCKGAGSARRDMALAPGRYRISIEHVNTECRELAKAVVVAGPDAKLEVDSNASLQTFPLADAMTDYLVPLSAGPPGGDTRFDLVIAHPTSVELWIAIEGGLHCWGYTLVERISIWREPDAPSRPATPPPVSQPRTASGSSREPADQRVVRDSSRSSPSRATIVSR